MNHTQLAVLITGGATGIGFALAEKFHSAGNRVILVGRSQTALSKAVSALPGAEAFAAAQLAEEFWEGFKVDRHEMLIGKTKLLSVINRLAPSLAERIMRRGL